MRHNRPSTSTNADGSAPCRRPARWEAALFGRLPLEHETCLFLLLNLADFGLTAWLTDGRGFREANWLALWVLQGWGWGGLLLYKFGLVTAICLLAQAIARQRPESARRLLNSATALLALVLLAAVLLAVLA